MIKAILDPQFGTAEQAKHLRLSLLNLPNEKGMKIIVEDVTNLRVVKINGKEEVDIEPRIKNFNGIINITIPEESAYSTISLLVFLSVKELGGYNLFKIIPCVYHLKKELFKSEFKGKINLSPSFVGKNQLFTVSVQAEPNTEYFVLINDRDFPIKTNEIGLGSAHVKASNFLINKDVVVLQSFPVGISKSLNETPFSSGCELCVLPNNVKTHVDPRCEISGYIFTLPDDCKDPELPTGENPCPPNPRVDPIDIETKRTDCQDKIVDYTGLEFCRINKQDSTILASGQTLHAVISVDSEIVVQSDEKYNYPRIFILDDESSLDVQVLFSAKVSVPPKATTDDLQIYVNKDTYEMCSRMSSETVYVVIFDEQLGYRSFELSGGEIPDVYSPFYRMVALKGESTVSVDNWILCAYAVFFVRGTGYPNIESSYVETLPIIRNSSSNPIPPLSVTIASNRYHVGSSYESYVYVIAEVILSNESQLFYYSFTIGETGYLSRSFGWKQITYDGNNYNPKAIVDSRGNVHVTWESDRAGSIQVYYGVLGPSSRMLGNTILSSISDKYAELYRTEDKPFTYVSENIIVDAGQEYGISPEIVFNSYPILDTLENGIVTMTGDNSFFVSGNPITDTAMFFYSLDSDSGLNLNNHLLQVNYQIDFNLFMSISRTSPIDENSTLSGFITSLQIDDLFSQWKQSFTLLNDSNIDNFPVYSIGNNNFIIGRQDSVYDRIFPIVGAYRNADVDVAVAESDIGLSFIPVLNGDDSNVRHWIIGVMPEKVRFEANNVIKTQLDWCSEQGIICGPDCGYVENMSEVVYTGKAKFVLVYNGDNSFYGTADSRKSGIIREIDGSFDLTESSNLQIVIGYTKLYAEDFSDLFEEKDYSFNNETSFYICTVTLFSNGNIVFSESFPTSLIDIERFDLGFGLPTGGYLRTDDFYPYESNIFDDLKETNFDVYFNNVLLTSPTFYVNRDISIVPSNVRSILSATRNDSYLSNQLQEFFENEDTYIKMGFPGTIDEDPTVLSDLNITDRDDLFLQLPITLEGINMASSIAVGVGDEPHLSWQSNRNKNWNIYYSNAVNINIPFRFDTMITNSTSNSLSPSVAVSRNGKRMICWHDNRNGNYDIYSAYSSDTSNVGQNRCSLYHAIDVMQTHSETLCNITFSYTSTATATYNFIIYFYNDSYLTDFYSSISSTNLVDGWQKDGIPFDPDGTEITNGQTVTITYMPKSDDVIFDRILYYKHAVDS